MAAQRRRTVAVAVAVWLFALLVAACGGGAEAPEIVLDGSPRRSNAEGVVTDVSVERLTIDGRTTYDVDPKLQAFDSATLKAIPVLARKGTYVQLGVAGKRVVWLAGYSAVVEVPGKPRLAFHTGMVAASKEGEIVFRDGSVLRTAPDVKPIPTDVFARADIDVERHLVIGLAPG